MARSRNNLGPLDELFPQMFRGLLNQSGADFVGHIGRDALRSATLHILLGNNVRTQTEPLTRQRIAEVSGACVAAFLQGCNRRTDFLPRASAIAREQLGIARSGDRASLWPAQWLLGITGKSFQNVLRSDSNAFDEYVVGFEGALKEAARILSTDLGSLTVTARLSSGHDEVSSEWGWDALARLMTMIGCAELVLRGADKSRYGKLFERLVLGTVLTCLGFQLSERGSIKRRERVFWLADPSGEREVDATALIRPGMVAKFDIGFIGIGNPEIVRDKLSRYARRAEERGIDSSSTTFIIVDRYPAGPRATSLQLAARSQAELIQMSMSLWPRELARRLAARCEYEHAIKDYDDRKMCIYLSRKLNNMDVMRFLRGIDPSTLDA